MPERESRIQKHRSLLERAHRGSAYRGTMRRSHISLKIRSRRQAVVVVVTDLAEWLPAILDGPLEKSVRGHEATDHGFMFTIYPLPILTNGFGQI